MKLAGIPLTALAAIICLAGLTGPAATAHAEEKVFRDHLDGAPERLDPVKCNSGRCIRAMWAIYEPLINLSADSKQLVPGLAESWEVSPDGLRYTFRLRRGVRFHDGAPFDAQAARTNLERHFVKTSPFYTSSPPNVREDVLAGLIQDVSIGDAHTLHVRLKSRKPYLLWVAPMVSPLALRRLGDKVGEHPVGTGPFKFLGATPEKIRLVANRDYWGGRPKIDAVEFRIIPQGDKRMEEFLANRLDLVPSVEPVYLERTLALEEAKQAKLLQVDVLHTFYLGFYVDRKPFDDVRVRRALTHALERERAIKRLSRGTAVLAHGPLPPGIDGSDVRLPRLGHNPATAAKLLAEAGVGPGLRVSLLYNEEWGFLAELAQAIHQDLGRIGVTVELVAHSNWRDLVAAVRKGEGDLFIYGRQSIFTDPEIFLGALFRTGAAENYTRYSSSTVDRLLKDAAAVADPVQQALAYRVVEHVVVTDAPMIFLYHEVRVSAHQQRVVGLELNMLALPVDRYSRLDLRKE